MSDKEPVLIIKHDGEEEPFDREKLFESLVRVKANHETAAKVVEHIEKGLKPGMTTSEIYREAFAYLRDSVNPIAARYSLRRALAELGPDGFPFEKYVAEIFKTLGYKTITDQIVQGGCVPHEVDVVAWNDSKLIMSEVKFHNEQSIKSDLKVALYVKARMDDLKKGKFIYGTDGKNLRSLDEGWLITNTKFSELAIRYGECVGLRMLGWSYPQEGNLEQLIEKALLHPLSCLTTLTNQHKKDLFSKGIVLCKALATDQSVLKDIGLNDTAIAKVNAEINQLCV